MGRFIEHSDASDKEPSAYILQGRSAAEWWRIAGKLAPGQSDGANYAQDSVSVRDRFVNARIDRRRSHKFGQRIRQKKVNTRDIPEESWISPKGKFASKEDLVMYLVADNPIGESCHFPDSNKWLVRSPERRLVRSESLEYLDGEE